MMGFRSLASTSSKMFRRLLPQWQHNKEFWMRFAKLCQGAFDDKYWMKIPMELKCDYEFVTSIVCKGGALTRNGAECILDNLHADVPQIFTNQEFLWKTAQVFKRFLFGSHRRSCHSHVVLARSGFLFGDAEYFENNIPSDLEFNPEHLIATVKSAKYRMELALSIKRYRRE